MLSQLLLVIAVLAVINENVQACTTFAVGKLATADGSVMATHSNDGGATTDPRLVKIPARDFSPNTLRPIYGSPENYPRYVGIERQAPMYYPENCQAGPTKCESFKPIGYIPQVNHTYAYFEATYGTINEKQVAIAESTCSGVFIGVSVAAGGKSLLSIDQLSQIAMERASTAREAITIMGALAEQYGFYGEDTSFEGGSESVFVTDPNEAWAFHILADPEGGSAIWGAARVPDDSVAVVTNMFSIREMDMDDTHNFLGRKDMWDIAEKQGLWTRGQPKDFTKTFSDGEYAHKYYSGRRMWGVFHSLGPNTTLPADYRNLKEDKPYPFAVKVDKKVTPMDMMAVMRDWYNGTRFTTGEGSGVAGGPWASPDRYSNNGEDYSVTGNWERTIALYRSSDSYVVQSRSWLPDEVGGVVWFGAGAAHSTVYVPILAGMHNSVDTLSYGWQGVYNTSTAYWANRRVLNYAQTKFNLMIEDIRKVQNTLETNSYNMVNDLSAKFDKRRLAGAGSVVPAGSTLAPAIPWSAGLMTDIDKTFAGNAWRAAFEMNKLLHYLMFTYADNYLNVWNESGFHTSSIGYPVWWMEAGNYKNGPPPVELTPTMRKLEEMRKKTFVAKVDTKKTFKHGRRGLTESTASSTKIATGLVQAARGDILRPTEGTRASNALDLKSCLQQCQPLADESYKTCTIECIRLH